MDVLPNFTAPGDDLVRLRAGAFDPLTDDPPRPGDVALVDAGELDPGIPQPWIVQVADGRFDSVRSAVEGAGATVLGNLAGANYVVSATPAQRASFTTDPDVRWTGYLQPMWRIPHASGTYQGLLDQPGEQDYRVYAFDRDARAPRLGADLAEVPGVQVITDDGGVVVDVRATAAEVPAIAALPTVQWVTLVPEYEPHNANARWVNDTGIRDVYAATAPGRLDGSGQTAAVADTAVNYVHDLNGRHHDAFDDCDPTYTPEPPAPTAPTVHRTYTFDPDLEGWTTANQHPLAPLAGSTWEHDPDGGTDGTGDGAAAVIGQASDDDGGYEDFSRAILTQPSADAVAFEDERQPKLVFQRRVSLEATFDFLIVEFSSDGGSSWTEAARFDDEDGVWKDTVVDVPAPTGTPVLFRYIVETDLDVSSGEGAWVDDVTILSGDATISGTGLSEDCKLADFTGGADLASSTNNRVAHGQGQHRKMAGYFDLGGAGVSPRDDSAHGTHVAGSVTGDTETRGTWDGEDGMAPAARLVHQNISTTEGGLGGLPDDLYQLFRQAYRPRNPLAVPESYSESDHANYRPDEDARTHNNSWGALPLVDPFGDTSRLDAFVWDHEDMSIVVSAGNAGPAPGTIGTPSTAKNNLSSAASANGRQPMASIDSIASFSSHGPTADGRLGPDLATPGQTVISPKGGSWSDDHYLQGTSMSGPVLAGLATLVRQYFFDGFGPADGEGFAAGEADQSRGHNPSAALVKATLVNGADRMRGYYSGDDGTVREADGQWPSYGQGFGLVNLDDSLYFADDPVNNWYRDVWRKDADAFAVSDGPALREYEVDVAEGEPLDVTLAWTDAPSLQPQGAPSTVNNLDLVVQDPTGLIYSGNNMNTRANPMAGTAETLPGPNPDRTNLVERVRIAAPAAGTWTVIVRADPVADGPQGFALAASGLISDPGGTAFAPGDPLQVDTPGTPTISDVSIETYSADTALIRFDTDEPTTATAVLDDVATTEDEALEFVDVYNRSDGSRFTEHFDTGTVETSEEYADLPVVGTSHEILVFGLDPGAEYDVTLSATDLADPPAVGTASTALASPDHAFQPLASDTGQLYGGDASDWQTGTQLYAGTGIGTGALGAFMVRLPEDVDPSEITGAAVELTGMHVLSSFYDADPQITVDLLDSSVEPEWGTQDYEQIHDAPADARAYPETKVLIGGQQRHAFSFACDSLNALRSTLEATDGERRAAFRIDSVVDAVSSLPSYEFGFNRRSRGPEFRPRLVLFTDGGGTNAPAPCDPSTPAPTISDVGVSRGLTSGSAVVSWRTDVPSDSVVIFREKGTDEWTQVGNPALETSHQVEVLGLDEDRDYEFGVRSTACNGAATTADNGGAGWHFFHPAVDATVRWFSGGPEDQATKLAGDPTATWTDATPTGSTPITQTSEGSVGTASGTPEDPASVFWTGEMPHTIEAGKDLEFEWWWSSRWGNVFVSTVVLTVFGDDPLTQVHQQEVSLQFPLGGAGTPTKNQHRIHLQNDLPAGPASIQVTPAFVNTDFTAHYWSTTEPSSFEISDESVLPEGLPLTGPAPPPSAGSSGLDIGSVAARATSTTADVAAGTGMACPPNTLTIDDVRVSEGDGAAELTVSLSREDDATVTVRYGMGDSTAAQGTDFTGVSGELTFEAGGANTQPISVPILDDDEAEDEEFLTVVLADASNATIARSVGTVTIADDDAPDGGSTDGGSSDGGTTDGGSDPGTERTVRLSGADRWRTAIDISRDRFADGSAGVVILARGDDGDNDDGYADALAGTPLAIELDAPLLITPPGGLRPEVEAEIRRVLGSSGRVVLLGGTVALDEDVERRIQQIGYPTSRLAGADRIGTALEIADAVDQSPGAVLLTRGWEFPDALAAGPAAAQVGGVILLNGDDSRSPAVDAYLDDHPGVSVHAIGGHMARLFPEANPVWGVDRFGTAVEVAEGFFDAPTVAGLARSDTFPDSLSGGAHIGLAGGPMLLTPPPGLEPTGHLHPATEAYVCDTHTSLTGGYVYGGILAVSDAARDVFADRILGTGC